MGLSIGGGCWLFWVVGGGGWICLGLISLGLTLDLVWLIWVGAEMDQLGEEKWFDLGFEKKKS